MRQYRRYHLTHKTIRWSSEWRGVKQAGPFCGILITLSEPQPSSATEPYPLFRLLKCNSSCSRFRYIYLSSSAEQFDSRV